MSVLEPALSCRACKRAGYTVKGQTGPCPYDAHGGDFDECMHHCCASCRRDCADALKEEVSHAAGT